MHEQRLASIKQLCRGYGDVSLRQDPITQIWKIEAPVETIDNVAAIGSGLLPSCAVDNLWNLLASSVVKIPYPNRESRYFKWDGIRWVDLGMPSGLNAVR